MILAGSLLAKIPKGDVLSYDVALHEFGHAADFIIGRKLSGSQGTGGLFHLSLNSQDDLFLEIHRELLLDPRYDGFALQEIQRPFELFAEAFAWHYLPGADRSKFHGSELAAERFEDYFTKDFEPCVKENLLGKAEHPAQR